MKRTFLSVMVLALVGCVGESRLIDTQQASVVLDGEDTFDLEVVQGDLFVEGVAGLDRIEVEVDLRTSRTVFAEDDRALETLNVELSTGQGNRAQLRVFFDDGAPDGYYADVRVRMPETLAVQADDGSGDTDISNVASLTMTDGSGDLTVQRIAGSVTLDDGSGDVWVLGAGTLDLTDDSGEVFVEDIAGDAQIDDDSGNIQATAIRGDLTLDDGSGDIDIDRIDGTATVRDGSGDIFVGAVGELVIEANGSGEVVRR